MGLGDTDAIVAKVNKEFAAKDKAKAAKPPSSKQPAKVQAKGSVAPMEDIDPRVITLGVVTCPKCELSGPINVAIVEKK